VEEEAAAVTGARAKELERGRPTVRSNDEGHD
jgi:hypothetical protein